MQPFTYSILADLKYDRHPHQNMVNEPGWTKGHKETGFVMYAYVNHDVIYRFDYAVFCNFMNDYWQNTYFIRKPRLSKDGFPQEAFHGHRALRDVQGATTEYQTLPLDDVLAQVPHTTIQVPFLSILPERLRLTNKELGREPDFRRDLAEEAETTRLMVEHITEAMRASNYVIVETHDNDVKFVWER